MASVAYKEINELITAVEVAGVALKEMLADGKINFGDIGTLLKLGNQLKVFNDAVTGLSLVTIGTLLQMTQEEMTAIVSRVTGLLKLVGLFKVEA